MPLTVLDYLWCHIVKDWYAQSRSSFSVGRKCLYMYVSHLTALGLVYELPLLVVNQVLSFPEGRRFLMETAALGTPFKPALTPTQGIWTKHTHIRTQRSSSHMMLTHRLPHPFNLGLSVVYKALSFSVSIFSIISN